MTHEDPLPSTSAAQGDDESPFLSETLSAKELRAEAEKQKAIAKEEALKACAVSS